MNNIKSRKRIISFILVAVMIISGCITVFATGADKALIPFRSLGSSRSNEITSTHDLEELANRVSNGDDCENLTFLLTSDLDIKELSAWSPIGTNANPFSGNFDGGGHTISGFGGDEYTTLFGTAKNATIKNLNVLSTNGGSGLIGSSISSNIENCNVQPTALGMSGRMLRAGIPADTSWHNTNPAQTFALSTPAELLGLLELTNSGTDDFFGDTISISGTVNLDSVGTEWRGIGTKTNPFKGAFSGGKIENLTIMLPGEENVGFFGYTDSATINNLEILNADITAGSYVGGIVGFMNDTVITNSFVTGKIAGTNFIGGAIGGIYQTVLNASNVSWTYSTANVTGIYAVGGFVGHIFEPPIVATSPVIENAFATGNVTGVIVVGGFAGEMGGYIWCENVASSGNVDGAGLTGGILGKGATLAAPDLSIRGAYTSSDVTAFSDSGATVGGNAYVESVYTSGHLIAPQNGTNNGYIWSVVGYSGQNMDAWAEHNTVYSVHNYMNEDNSHPQFAHAEGTVIGSGVLSGHFDDDELAGYFNTDPTEVVDAAFFQPANLIYPTPDPLHPDLDVATSGHYPKLLTFEGSSIEAFKQFSYLTTEVAAKNIPSRLYFGNDGNAAPTAGGASFTLPSVAGIVWKINGQSSITVEDATLPSGVNNIAIASGKLKLDAPLNKPEKIVLSADVAAVPGLEIKYVTTLMDEAVRTIDEQILCLFMKARQMHFLVESIFPLWNT